MALMYKCDRCAKTDISTVGARPKGWEVVTLPTDFDFDGTAYQYKKRDLCGACLRNLVTWLTADLAKPSVNGTR